MNNQPYWLASAPPFSSSHDGRLPPRADAVVIGGGFTGLSAARELTAAGASTVVLEADRVVGQASGRNGGHCNTGTSQNLTYLIRQHGLEQACRYYRAYADAVDHVEAIVREEAIDCDFTRTGKLKLASKPEHYAGIAQNVEALRAHVDEDVELVPPEEIRRHIASDLFHGGMIQRRSGHMHMGKFGVGLAEAAARKGAQIHEHCPVTGLTPLGGGRFRVHTGQGEIMADRVLLATGCSTGSQFRWWQRRIVPIGSFVIATEPLDDALIDRVFPGRRTYVTSRVIGNYFRLTADNRLIFGGRARFARSNPRSDAKSGAILEAGLRQMFPDLAQARIAHCWGGLVDMTADRLPRAGQHEGLHYALGYSGHGTQMSVHLGSIMAHKMLGRQADHPWDRGNWAAVPGHQGKAWFLPLAGLYYRYKDRFH